MSLQSNNAGFIDGAAVGMIRIMVTGRVLLLDTFRDPQLCRALEMGDI